MGEAVRSDRFARRVEHIGRANRPHTPKIELLAAPSVTAGSFKPKKLTALGYGRRNPSVATVRNFTAMIVAVNNQAGRRYGPEPRNITSGRAAPKGRRTAALAEKHARAEITS
jgi:hypothetical protein